MNIGSTRKKRAYKLAANNIGLNADADALIRYLDGQDSDLNPKMQEIMDRVVETKALILQHGSYPRVVNLLKKIHGYSEATAYRDIRLVEKVIGNLLRASKDVKRAIAEEMILKTKELAEKTADSRGMAACDKNYITLHALDKEDTELPDLSNFEFHTIVVAVIPEQVGLNPPTDEELASEFDDWCAKNVEDIDYEEEEEVEDAG